ncbi:DUF21 domain-containing protein [Candidatus Saccharibacteria bacterium]|nr:DUF21 domain-containing protein [Candidatus Saccharibacteria bacterium]
MNIITLISTSTLLITGSAVCSGLNVALLSLDLQDLRRKTKLGDMQAKRALAIRRNVHFYLSGILLTNVTFASATSVVLGDALSGVWAVIISTLLLVTLAEITPQAIAVSRAKHAISFFSPLIRFVSYAAYPITKPLEFLLNAIVGKTAATLHSRHELGLLISEHLGKNSELDDDEVEIVQGALQLSEKRVHEIMTPIKHTYYLFEGDIIDAQKVDELKEYNYSRIPIFDKKLTKCRRFLVLKDLVDIDFDERSYTLDELKTHEAKTVGSMTALDTMFRKFIAAKKHIMIVERDKKIIGIVTVEDLVEEIIGHEIEDESDAEKHA